VGARGAPDREYHERKAREMGKRRRYDFESVERALEHHERNGAGKLGTSLSERRPFTWTALHASGITLDLTLPEAYALCVGLAEAERAYGGKVTA
jgi:hypothetical protein